MQAQRRAAAFFRNGPPDPVGSRRSGVFLMKEMIMLEMLKQFVRDEEGVTAIEYGLIAALIAVTIIISVTAVGDNLVLVFEAISGALSAAI